MYQQFFNFNAAPFSIAPDPSFIYMSEHHKEGLAHLIYGISQGGGFVALTGEVGTGKTTLCHCLLDQLPNNIDIALVLNPKLNAVELLATICDELHIAYNQQKQTLKYLIDSLNKHLLATHARGKRTVLMIDEAQNLSLDVLEQIRLLTNLETSKTKLLQIILIGQPELKRLLQLPELRQLNQRITARYHLTALSYSDTQKYIKHRLELCGGNAKIFSHAAIAKIYNLSKGIPRLINILCDRALLGAYVGNTKTVSAKTIKTAAKETINSTDSTTNQLLRNAALTLLFVSSLALFVFYWVPEKPQKKHIILSGSFNPPSTEKKQQQLIIDRTTTINRTSLLDFRSTISQSNTPLNVAIHRLAIVWGKKLSINSNCKQVESTGLKCLLDKASWKDLIALNKPVIMEFSFSESERFYALLLGIRKGNPVFFVNKDISFPIEQVLTEWNGYFLMLWQPPIGETEYIYPGQSSEAVLWIRKQLHLIQTILPGKTNSTYFDNQLKNKVIQFQKQQQITPDGIVGPKTFIHLINNDPYNNSPILEITR